MTPPKTTRPQQRRPTLADVARAAGVGKATASRALAAKHHPDVGEATRAAVWAAAESLGYRPSSTARALRTGRFHALSVVVPYNLVDWLEPALRAAGAEAADSDYQLLVHPVDTHGAGVDPLLDRLNDVPTDAVILIDPALSAEQEKRLRGAGRPVVFFDDLNAHPWAANITAANRDGGYQAGRHLVSCGRRRIVAVVDSTAHTYVAERLAGLGAALAEAGLEAAAAPLAVTGKDGDCRVVPESGAMKEIVREFGIDGVFAVADWLAAAVLRDLRRAGFDVPGDISVVGFDDERLAGLVDPPLTTVRQPTDAIGRMAVRLAIRAAEGDPPEPGTRELPVELVVRESSVPQGS